jgi:hypothetical protein
MPDLAGDCLAVMVLDEGEDEEVGVDKSEVMRVLNPTFEQEHSAGRRPRQ